MVTQKAMTYMKEKIATILSFFNLQIDINL